MLIQPQKQNITERIFFRSRFLSSVAAPLKGSKYIPVSLLILLQFRPASLKALETRAICFSGLASSGQAVIA